jgi:acylphosphatase
MHAIVKGIVQGVGYRHFVRAEALRLGLGGWAENRPDGTVEVVATGPRPALERLLQALHLGPPKAQVDAVLASWDAAVGAGGGFVVRR